MRQKEKAEGSEGEIKRQKAKIKMKLARNSKSVDSRKNSLKNTKSETALFHSARRRPA
jgi:hypothetical protein